MKFYDINTSIGGWPFRRVSRSTADELRQDLTALGAVGALTANNKALLYSDTREGNLELIDMLKDHQDFFSAAMTIDPTAPQAEEEVKEFAAMKLFKAIRLLPLFHRYDPACQEALNIAKLAGKLKLPVIFPSDPVNFRQRHFLAPETALAYNDLLPLIRQVPETVFIWTDSNAYIEPPLEPNLYCESGRLNGVYFDSFPELARKSVSHMIFGTGAPLRSPEANLIKLYHLEVSEEEKENICLNNARKLGFF